MEYTKLSFMETKMALKVCQLCAVDFTLKHFLTPLIQAMQNEGWEVTSVCSDGKYVKSLRKEGFKVKTIQINRNFNFFKHLSSIFKLTLFFREQQFDIVHVHSPIAALLGRFAARLAGVPIVIYTAHGFYFHDQMSPLKFNIFLTLEKFNSKFTDILFTQSIEDSELAKVEKLAPLSEIEAIGNGVDIKKFHPSRVKNKNTVRGYFNLPEGAYVIGVIARLVKEKGILEFLEAAEKISNTHKEAYFLLVGDRLASDHGQDIFLEIEKYKDYLGSRLVITGHREDVPDILSSLDAFCLPSWREGMPRTIIEAMMMEKPVVATNIRGSREEVLHGETGLLVPAKSSSALAEAFSYLLLHKGESVQMGRRGRRRALKLYDERRVISIQIEKIKTFLEKRNNNEASV